MSSPFSFSKDLFVAQDGTPMDFSVSRCKNGDSLKDSIEYGGGLVQEELTAFTIVLEDDVQESSTVTQESFLSDFIIQCCRQDKILPLAQFRSNSVSMFSDDFDPNDVLEHKISWEQSMKEYKNISADSTSDPSASSICEEDVKRPLTRASGPKTSKRSCRQEFTHLERKKMVEFIVKNKAFNQVTGTALWKRMHLQMYNHTWQSLKEHFIKKVMPLIHTYNLSPDEVQLFRNGSKFKNSKRGSSSYSSFEDDRILKYVSLHADHNTALGGTLFWMEMEEKKYIPGRTWQSVKERYMKHLKGRLPLKKSGSGGEKTAAETKSLQSVPSTSKAPIVSASQLMKSRKVRCSTRDSSPITDNESGPNSKRNKSYNHKDESQQDGECTDVLEETSGDDRTPEQSVNTSKDNCVDNVPSLDLPFSSHCNKSNIKQELKQGEEGEHTLEESSEDDRNLPGSSVSTPEHGDMENTSIVDPYSSTPVNQRSISKPSKEEHEERSSVESGSCGQGRDSEFPSNFPPEVVVFVSDSEEPSFSEDHNEENVGSGQSEYEDSPWSDDGLFWRGGIEFPDASRKKDPVAHLHRVASNVYHESNEHAMTSRQEEQCELDRYESNEHAMETRPEEQCKLNGDQPKTNFLNTFERNGSEHTVFTSSKCESQKAKFNFLHEWQNSYDASQTSQVSSLQCNETQHFNSESNISMAGSQDNSQQISDPSLEASCTQEPQGSNSGGKTDNAKFKNVSVPAKVSISNKRDASVQTDPVLILPKGWLGSEIKKQYFQSLPSNVLSESSDGCPSPICGVSFEKQLPCLPSNVLSESPDGCPSPVPADL